jgi:hypothetical protein
VLAVDRDQAFDPFEGVSQLGRDYVSRDLSNKVDRIGDKPVTYGLDGRIQRIGEDSVLYQSGDRIAKVGHRDVLYGPDGRITSIGSAAARMFPDRPIPDIPSSTRPADVDGWEVEHHDPYWPDRSDAAWAALYHEAQINYPLVMASMARQRTSEEIAEAQAKILRLPCPWTEGRYAHLGTDSKPMAAMRSAIDVREMTLLPDLEWQGWLGIAAGVVLPALVFGFGWMVLISILLAIYLTLTFSTAYYYFSRATKSEQWQEVDPVDEERFWEFMALDRELAQYEGVQGRRAAAHAVEPRYSPVRAFRD